MIKIMKRTTAIAAIAAALTGSVLTANATIVDLGERDLAHRVVGIDATIAYIEMDQGLAPGTLSYLNSFDVDDGWINTGEVDSSHFGVTLLDGGVNANISWDLGTTGFQLSYVFLKDGRGSTHGPYLYHLYGVTPDEVFNSMGDQFVTVNGVRYITYMSFFGVPGSPVPEEGTTLILLGAGLGAVELIRRTLLRHSA